MANLCLGTAQIGMNYGINNKVGKLDREAAYEILHIAVKNGIDMIDTASIYGEAEEILGEFLSSHMEITQNIHIISKQCCSISGMNAIEIEKVIRTELSQTLSRLKRKSLDGYLLHSYREIENPEALKVLKKLKAEGLVNKIGVSVYEIDEAENAIKSNEIDYLQMPCSIFDQRGLKTGIFKRAKQRGITVFTRSAFLQGLLMMREEDVPEYLQEIIPYIREFDDILHQFGINKKHAIVKFILSEHLIDYMVFGVETKEQIEEIIAERNRSKLTEDFMTEIRERFADIPTNLILPIHWRENIIT